MFILLDIFGRRPLFVVKARRQAYSLIVLSFTFHYLAHIKLAHVKFTVNLEAKNARTVHL
jgi:hypothetical protein